MASYDEDVEVFNESAPQTCYLKSLGFDNTDYVSMAALNGPSQLEHPSRTKDVFSAVSSACRVFKKICSFIKEAFIPSTDYSIDIDIIKHSGLLFKENAVLVEEFSPPSTQHPTYVNISIILPLSLVVLYFKKPSKIPLVTVLGFSSIYVVLHAVRLGNKSTNHDRTEGLVSALKQFNKKFLKSLQFIAENDRKMMMNHSNLTKIEVRGFNTYKILDPSWSHFKLLVAKSALSILHHLHSLCRDLSKTLAIHECTGYPSVCSVPFSELGVSDIEMESHQAYVRYLNKLKILLFLMESEFLSFIAINLSDNSLNTNSQASHIFSAIENSSKTLLESLTSIGAHFDRLYSSSKEEMQLSKGDALTDKDPDIIKLFLETRALAHSSLSISMMSRNLEKVLDSEIQTMKMDKSNIITLIDELISNIDNELVSFQRKLKYLTKIVSSIQEPSSDASRTHCTQGNLVSNKELEVSEEVGIEVGHSDFNPTEPDDVFLGFSEGFTENLSSGEEDYFLEENSYSAALKKSSKILIKELKLKLQDKKIEMDEREKIALQRKNIPDLIEDDNELLNYVGNDSFSAERVENTNSEDKNVAGKTAPFVLTLEDEMRCTHIKSVNPETSVEDRVHEFRELIPPLPSCPSARPDQNMKISEAEVTNSNLDLQVDVTKNGIGSCNPEKSVVRDSWKSSHPPLDESPVSKQSLHNPLAMNITNISRVWNQQLNRTEECFGSDSDSSSDHELV